MKVIITGGTGFIGSHLAEAMKEHEVTIYGPRREHDILNYKPLKKAIKEQDVVFHLAAETKMSKPPSEMFDVNTRGTLNVLNAMLDSDVKRLVSVSSAAVYGDMSAKGSEEMACEPISVYGASKLAAESYVNAYSECYGISAASLRYFNVYGSRGRSVINHFLNDLRNNKEIVIFGDGKKSRDYIHVYDVVNATLLAMKSKSNGVFNIGTGRSASMKELIDIISEAIGKKVHVKYGAARKGDIFYSCADTKKAEQILGFKSQITLEKGISDLTKINS